jgi:hypothetical protein
MRHGDEKRARIALLIVVAMIAILLAVLEAFAADSQAPDSATTSWGSHLRQLDDALQRKNGSGAVRAWHDAYGAALGSRRWEGMLAVGRASLRLGGMAHMRATAGSKARQAYLIALFRARDEKSIDGLLDIGEALARVGDVSLASYCLSIVEPLIATDPVADARAERVRMLRYRLGEPAFARRDLPPALP